MNSANRNIYPWAFGMSFLILTLLIGFLIFNTYKLEDRNYQIGQLGQIQNAYGAAVMDDKIFPGGNTIFQTSLVPCLSLWSSKVPAGTFDSAKFAQQCMEPFLKHLRQEQSLDSIFQQIIQKQQLDKDLVYLFHFNKLEVYDSTAKVWKVLYETVRDNPAGAIAGRLENTGVNNRVFELSVSDKSPSPYRFTYSLYVDYENRGWRIAQQMAPVFLLSLTCIAVIVLLSYRTYSNWISQRKLADLKTSFLNHMRHEFNTPLTTILISAHSLIDRETGKDDKEVAQIGRIVERQAKRLKAYFEQVMGSVALQERQPKIVQLPLNGLTEQLLDELRLRYHDEIELRYEALRSDIEMKLDEDYYFSILDNLVSNAIKFNDSNEKYIRFTWQFTEDQYCLKIADNGSGISPDERAKVFTAFYRGRLSGNKPGLGLGLYYIKSCLDRLGWAIHMEERASAGTIFYIYMGNAASNGKRQD